LPGLAHVAEVDVASGNCQRVFGIAGVDPGSPLEPWNGLVEASGAVGMG